MSLFNRLHCPKCDADFGQEVRLLRHLTDIHSITDHLVLYVELHCNNVHPTCACSSECDVKLHWLGWKRGFVSKFARGHNARVDSVFLNTERQEQFVAKRMKGFASGRLHTWNDGLTKETDERVANQSRNVSVTLRNMYDNGHVSWQTGLTSDNDERAARLVNARKRALGEGRISVWNKGKTKLTDARLVAIAKKISIKARLCDTSRLSPDEFAARVAVYDDKFELVTDPKLYRNKRFMFDLRCRACGVVQSKCLPMLISCPKCFVCHPKESLAQLEMYEFVKALVPDALSSNRTAIAPKELDIYVPSKRFGIEYDGLYWHSDVHKDEDYASYKLSLCKSAGISFMGIFEDEWRDKRHIVGSLICHRLGVFDERIGARECVIEEVSQHMQREFFDTNHIDGGVRCSVAWILRRGDKVVATLSLRKPFHASSHGNVYEIARFCTLSNTSAPGALSRLVKHASTWAKSQGASDLLTYVDQRIGDGHGHGCPNVVMQLTF